jgi:hypothetical protein
MHEEFQGAVGVPQVPLSEQILAHEQILGHGA